MQRQKGFRARGLGLRLRVQGLDPQAPLGHIETLSDPSLFMEILGGSGGFRK